MSKAAAIGITMTPNEDYEDYEYYEDSHARLPR